jgi:hypothetical protein
MSNNISATNFAIAGTSAFTGTLSLASQLISGSTGSFQGLTTTDLTTTGNVIHDVLPICNVLPVSSNELSNKGYVDTANAAQDVRLTNIDNLNIAQNNRLTGVESVNTTQNTRLTNNDALNIVQNDRLTSTEAINTTQDTRLDEIDALDVIQDDRILVVEDRTTNISFLNNRTTLTGAITVANTLTFTVPPLTPSLPTVSSQLANKQYVDNNVQTLTGSILVTNNAAAALTSRVAIVESKTSNLSYAAGSNTTSISGPVSFLNAPTIAATSTAANSVQTKAYIDGRDQLLSTSIVNLETRATAIEGVNGTQATAISGIQTINTAQANSITALETVNTTQNTNITAIQAVNTTQNTNITAIQAVNTTQNTNITAIQAVNTTQNTNITAIQTLNTTQSTNITNLQTKTNQIAYSVPVAGALTEITSSVSLLPYTNATIMKAFTVTCNAFLCSIQATFGGTGANQGVTTSQLTVGGFGTTFKTVYFGSVTSVVGQNIVNFATPLTTTTFPKVFIQAIGGTVLLTNKTLAGFIFTATSVVNVDYWVVQGL